MPPPSQTAERLFKRTVRITLWSLLSCVLIFPGDYLVWRIKVARGGGIGTVSVSQMTAASLKGNKDEYYFDGTEDVQCSQSLFGWTGSGACWWLQRHREVVTQD